MTTTPSLYRGLLETTSEHWKDALLLMLFSSVGGLAPVWIGVIVFLSFGESVTLQTFARSGEFALYTAALIAPTIYLIVRDRGKGSIPGHTTYMLIALVAILMAVTGYAMMAPAAFGVIPLAGLRLDLIAPASLILYVLSLGLAFVVTSLDNARTQPAIREIAERRREQLEKDFDRLDNDDGR